MSSVTDLTWDHSAGENLQTYDNLSEDSITFPTGYASHTCYMTWVVQLFEELLQIKFQLFF